MKRAKGALAKMAYAALRSITDRARSRGPRPSVPPFASDARPRRGGRSRLAAGLVLAALSALPVAAQTAPSLAAFGLLVAEQSRPSFAVVGAGARAAGMGGAFTALADDASAASFNPAGLSLLLRPEASVVVDARRRNDHFAAFDQGEVDSLELYDASRSSFDTTDLNFASFTYPLLVAERNLTFQLSYHRQIDFTFQSERQFDQRHDGAGDPVDTIVQQIDQNGDVSTLSIAAAYQLTQRMSLGLTLSRWMGDWTFSTLTRETVLETGEEDSLRYSQDNSWRGWNATLGVLLRYRYLNLGATLRSPFDGDFQVLSGLDTSFETPFEATSRFDGTLSWPSSWTFGAALKPMETWVVTADYAEFDWDDLEIKGLGDEPVNFFDLRPKSSTTARHTGQWRFGTELTLFPAGEQIGLRAGYFSVPRPVPMAPPGKDNSVNGYTLGVGWKHGPISVDLAYQRSDSTALLRQFVDPEAVGSGLVVPGADSAVDVTEERLFVSLLYQFESRPALRRLGHFLFVGPLDRAGSERGDKSEEKDREDEQDGESKPSGELGSR